MVPKVETYRLRTTALDGPSRLGMLTHGFNSPPVLLLGKAVDLEKVHPSAEALEGVAAPPWYLMSCCFSVLSTEIPRKWGVGC